MGKAVWVTDIHLNFLDKLSRHEFYADLKGEDADCIFVTGDIGEARTYGYAPATPELLLEMQMAVGVPMYFVLGNHDFYFSDVSSVRASVVEVCKSNPDLYYLNKFGGFYDLGGNVLLCGVDGFADARAGNYAGSRLVMNDSLLIKDLVSADKDMLRDNMKALSDADTQVLLDNLEWVFIEGNQKPKRVIILTHVPPFKEACLYNRAMSSDEALPFYCNYGLGHGLLGFIDRHQLHDVSFDIYCGHTHSSAVYKPRDNVIVCCGVATYNDPTIAGVIEY